MIIPILAGPGVGHPLVAGTERGALTWVDAGYYRKAALEVAPGGSPGFELQPNAALGVQFTNTLAFANAIQNHNLMNGAGVALGDYDRDGLCDIYLCNLDGKNALYRNLGGWRFENTASTAGVEAAHQSSTGACFADWNGDGHLDLFVSACGGPNALFINDGRGRFTDVTDSAGLTSDAGSTSIAAGDVDMDGDLDLYVANYANYAILRSGAGKIRFRTMSNGQRVVTGRFRERLRILPDGNMIELGEPDALYLNDGRGRFTAVQWRDGAFTEADGETLRDLPRDLGLSVMFRDINRDGAPDIYVCNDFQTIDRFWINDGAGRFRALDAAALRTTSAFSMSVDFADIDRDGYDDFFLADMLSRDHRMRMTQIDDPPVSSRRIGEFMDRPEIRRNTLFINDGQVRFREIARFAGLHASEWTWCAAFLDVDLDGYEDLLIANGHAFDTQDLDAIELNRVTKGSLRETRDNLRLFPRLETANLAFRNRGDLTFEEVGHGWGFDSTQVSHGMACGDLDNDGDLDLVVNCLNAPPLIYRNRGSGARVSVQLRGNPGNSGGVGARMIVDGTGLSQSQEMIAGGRYLSSDQARRTFALHDSGEPHRLTVRWASGRVSQISNLSANHLYEIIEPARGESDPSAEANTPDAAAVEPLFEDVSHRLGHRHVDAEFDEETRQPMLPRHLGGLGPGIAWLDLDQDGFEDLFIATGREGKAGVFRNTGSGSWTPWVEPGWDRLMTRDQTTVVGWPRNRDDRGALVGVSNYEDGLESGAALIRYGLRQGAASTETLLSPGSSSVGPVVVADWDADGDLDGFLGGRVVPGRYPDPAQSVLLRNDRGTLVRVRDEWAGDLFETAGLVSGAVFSDLDSDGYPELILAIEWGSIRVFRNREGRFEDATAALGLDRFTGWWNGITTGDFDGDGRMDLAATNWGLNSEYRATADTPLRLVHGDLDGSGTVDLIEAYQESPGGAVLPRRQLGVLTGSIPRLQLGFPTHAAYSRATLDEVLSAAGDGPRRVLTCSTLAHTVFLNRGSEFLSVPLPDSCQWAPGFAVCAADFDGDGLEDLFLSQNFFGFKPGTPRLAAGRGACLIGDGKGGFRALTPEVSGILAYGEQRGAAVADFDHDGRVDLALTQRGAETRLYRNRSARPGVRVILEGPTGNPDGVGAVIRIRSRGRLGPAREIHGGSGYWSQDGVRPVLAAPEGAAVVEVRWPGGSVTRSEVAPGMGEVRVRFADRGRD